MKEQFADYDTSKMLKELGFNQPCYARYNGRVIGENVCIGSLDHNTDNAQWVTSAPLWQQVEQWLWEKHKMVVCCDISRDKDCHCVIRGEDMGIIIPEILEKPDDISRFDSPITAKTEGIKQAVLHLCELPLR